MSEEDRRQQDGPSWFLVDATGEDELFPQPPVAPIPPPARVAAPGPAQTPPRQTVLLAVPPADLAAPAIAAGGGASAESYEASPVDAGAQQSEAHPPVLAPCAPLVLDEVSPPTPIPATAAPSHSNSGGFLRAELIRVGGTAATPPLDRIGFLVVVRTPQPVRLGQVVPLKDARNVLGRGSGLGCFLDDPGAAEFHAVITYQRQKNTAGFFLHSSTAAVGLNGVPAAEQAQLESNDRITIGNTELVFLEVQITRGDE